MASLWKTESDFQIAVETLESAPKVVVRASRSLARMHPAGARERDAPATAGETPAPHPFCESQ